MVLKYVQKIFIMAGNIHVFRRFDSIIPDASSESRQRHDIDIVDLVTSVLDSEHWSALIYFVTEILALMDGPSAD